MRKKLNGTEYEYIDPTGNITVLVTDEVNIKSQPEVADMIMKAEPACEQTGFIFGSQKADIGLRMAAGEFCGNATMSAAALHCDMNALAVGCSKKVTVDASGCARPVEVNITRTTDRKSRHIYAGAVNMPEPVKISSHVLPYSGKDYELPVVEFEGISHIIVRDGLPELADGDAETAIRTWCSLLGADALGIMKISSEESSPGDAPYTNIGIYLKPLVYVSKTDTLFWENSCASGTTAVGAYYREIYKRSDIKITAREPGGVLTAECKGRRSLILGGTVAI